MALELAAAAIPAVGSLLGSLIGSDQQKIMQERAMRFQAEENAKAREWQSQEWLNQFNITNEYNKPENTIGRLLGAGLNPSAMFGSGTSTTASAATPSTPSTPLAASPAPEYGNILTSGFQNITAIADAVNKYVQAQRTAAETPYVGAKWSADIDEIRQSIKNAKAQQEFTELQTALEYAFGGAKRSKELEHLQSEILRSYGQLKLLGEQATTEQAKRVKMDFDNMLSYSQKHLNEVNAALVEKRLAWFDAEMNATISELSSRSRLQSAQASTENALRSLRTGLLENELRFNSDTFYDRVDAVRENLDRSILTNEEVKQALERMKFANGLKEFDYWYGQLLRTISTLTSGVPGRVAPGEFSTIHDAVESTPGRVSVNGFKP